MHSIYKWFPDRQRALPTSVIASGAAFGTYRQLLLSRTAVGVFLAGFAAYSVIALNITWLANYLVKQVHVTLIRAGWIIGFVSLMQIMRSEFLNRCRHFSETDEETILFWHRGLSLSDIALGHLMLEKAKTLRLGQSLRYM